MRPRRFTLVELVVVVAIIAVLSGLRLPSARSIGRYTLTLQITGQGQAQLSDSSLPPTRASLRTYEWNLTDVFTDRGVVLDVPATLSPLGRVLLLMRLTAVAVLLFGLACGTSARACSQACCGTSAGGTSCCWR